MTNKLIASCLCLALAFATMAAMDPGSSVEGKESAGNTVSYVIRDPFRINSNADFPAYANGGGDGSAGSPWVMENYDIDGTGYGYCIYIGNTTEHFVVRDCYLHGASGHVSTGFWWKMDSGIFGYDVQNGNIINNTVTGNDGYGINFYFYCWDNTIADNNISNNPYGIFQQNSWMGNSFVNNTFSNNDYGLAINGGDGNDISENKFFDNDFGILLSHSTGNTLTGNTMMGDGIVIQGVNTEAWDSHTIDTTNTVNSKPVRYHKNQNGGSVPMDAGQIILARCNNIVIENQNISNTTVGILLGLSSSITLRNNNFTSCRYGAYLQYSDDNDVFNNTASNCTYGLYLQYSDDNDIFNNTALDNLNGIILSFESSFNRLTGNTADSNGETGIGVVDWYYSSYNNTLSNNTVFKNPVGIRLEGCRNASVVDNAVFNNTFHGILVGEGSEGNLIGHNNVSYNNMTGITLVGCLLNTVKDNNVSSNGEFGIEGRGGSENRVLNNTVHGNGLGGIKISVQWMNYFENNTVTSNPAGFLLDDAQFALVKNNCIVGNNAGIVISSSGQNRIFGNHIDDSGIGIILHSSASNYIAENLIFNSTGMIGSSSYYSFEAALDVYQNDPDWAAYSSFEEQLATGDGGNPLFTRAVDLADTVLFEVSISGHANSRDLDLGIFLDGKGGNPVDGITQTGEFVAYSADWAAEESVRLLAPEDGTYLIRVFGFNVAGDPGQFDMEINIINASSTGIFMMGSTHNNVVNNNISHNNLGLNLTMGSDFNRLHYNNIAGNGVQAFDDGVNFWNTSYLEGGGNFWSDYAGADSFSGPGQDIPGADGIGDTPYTNILGGGNEDVYPLMDYTDGVYIDNTPPTSHAVVTGEIIFLELDYGSCDVSAHATDDYSGIADATLWYRHSIDNVTWGTWAEYPREHRSLSWLFDPVFMTGTGEGHYQFYTIATDYAGNVETKPQAPEAYWLFDVTAPQSRVLQPATYWNIPDLDMGANVTDNTNSTSNVDVFYRYSLDNATWGGWVLYRNLTSEPWNFTFDFPNGQGHYQFYSRANDTTGNLENATAAAQARVGYDITAPEITDSSPGTGTTGDAYAFLAQVTDNIALGEVRVVYRFGTGTEANATMTQGTADTYELDITVPIGSLDMLHYRIVALDEAGNWNSTSIRNILIADNDAPAANAGPDQSVDAGTVVTFNGSASTDNISIVNFTWTFNYGMGNITLYGVNPTHNFTVPGNYTVTLTVRDVAGNTATDTMVVGVSAIPSEVDTTPPVADAGPDQSVNAGTLVTFTGTGSTDNVGIANYTWTFIYNGTDITLYDVSPTFRFWTPSNYTVTLTARDAAGNTDSDTVLITVTPVSGPGDDDSGGIGDYWWIILLLIIVLAVGALLGLKMVKGKKPDAPITKEATTEPPIEEDLTSKQSTEPPKNE